MSGQQKRIMFAQINPKVGDLAYNRHKMVSYYEKALHEGADMVVFPEHALTGYPLEDLMLQSDFLSSVFKEIEKLVEHIQGEASLVFGSPFCSLEMWQERKDHKWLSLYNKKADRKNEGEAFFNAALVVESGEIVHITHKRRLPNRGIFDEKRYYEEGKESHVYPWGDHKIGFLICDDLWYPEVAKELKEQGASVFISLNGSPYTAIKSDERLCYVRRRIQETSLPFSFLNLVGGQDEVVFDGGSFIMDDKGELVDHASFFEEDMFLCRLDIKEGKSVWQSAHNRDYAPLTKEEKNYGAMVLGLRDYVCKQGFKEVLLGLSGGIDSALTAAVAVDALGCENVRVCVLPTQYTSKESWEDAYEIIRLLGIHHRVIDIEDMVSNAMNVLEPAFLKGDKGTTEENIQARLRGLVLMAVSNKEGSLLLTTGNKSEVAVGYCTMYGDMAGGFNVLKDLYKTEVFAVSRWRCSLSSLPSFYKGKGGQVMPERVITKAPSAELRFDQKDEDTLPAYSVLDSILSRFIEGRCCVQDIIKEGYDAKTVLWVMDRLKNAEYKRFQAAPGVKLSKVAFGRDWRYPLVNGFNVE